MDRLVILSERDVSKFLSEHNIVPHEFYTDLNMFKRRIVGFKDVSLVILFTGCGGFVKKQLLRYINSILDSQRNLSMKMLKKVIVLSDTVIPFCKTYYKYADAPLTFIEYSGWDKVGTEKVDVWGSLENMASVTEKKFLREASKMERPSEEDYRSYIVIPKIDSIN